MKYTDNSGHIPLDILLDIAFLIYDVEEIVREGPTQINIAALAADAACAVIPYGTGGGPILRLGGEAALQAVSKIPLEIRILQGAEKIIQFIVGNNDLSLSDLSKKGSETYSLPGKKLEQFKNRGWTPESIMDTIANPAMTRSTKDNPSVYNKATKNPVTYYYRSDGYYVVVDDVTHEVIQAADTKNPYWIDQMTNKIIEPIKSK